MAYPVTISILVHGFVLVANIILLGLTEGNLNEAVDPVEATTKRLHVPKEVNEGKGSVDRFGSVSLQELLHPAYYVNDGPVQSDPFLSKNQNSGKIDQNHITDGIEGHLHSDASGEVAVSDMHSLAAKLQFLRRTSWERGVRNNHRLVNTDQLHDPLLGEGNYHHDMNTNEPDNVPVEQKALYTYGQTVKKQKGAIKHGSVKRMQQLETLSSERNQAQYLTFGENWYHKIHYKTKDSLDEANSANILLPNANGLDGENTINNFKLDDRMADPSVFYLVAKRNEEAVSPSYTPRISLSDEENSVKPVGYSDKDSELTLTRDIDVSTYKHASINPERPPENHEGLQSDWDEIAPKFRNSHGNHPIIKSNWSPDLTIREANIDWSDQKPLQSIKADFIASRGAHVDASIRIDQTVMYNPEETNLITNFNNADTDTFTDSYRQGEVYLIDPIVNLLPDTTNEDNSNSIFSSSSSQGVFDPNNRPYNTDKFADPSDPNEETLTHRIGPNDSVGRFPGVSSSAQLMRKAAVQHSYDDYHWTAPVENSPGNKGNGINIKQQSKPRSNEEAFDPNRYIIPQQLHEKQSSRWSTGKHTSHDNVYELHRIKQKEKNSLAQNMHSKSSNLNQNSNIEFQMMDTSRELGHFSQPINASHGEFNVEERDLDGNFSSDNINKTDIAKGLSVPKQKQPNTTDRHAGPRIIQTKINKPNETLSGRSSHTATEQLHRSTSNKPNVGPFSLNKNQTTQESRMLKEKRENPHAAHLNENGDPGIEQLPIAGTLYRSPKRPHMNLNYNMTTQKQPATGQEKINRVNVADLHRTGIESTLMDIDLANGHKVPPAASYPATSQSDPTPERSSEIDLNVQFADDAILGNSPGKTVSQSISIDPPNSQMSLKYYSQSDWSHTAYDHVQQSKEFIQRIFSKQHSSTPIKDFVQESFQNHGKTSQTDHLSVRLKRDINNGGFLSSMTRSSNSHGDRKKRSADTVGNNLFHWSTMSRSTPSPVFTKSYGSKLEHNVNTVSSNNRIVPYSNHFTSLVPDDENSKSNPDQSIIRHLQRKLLRNHPHGHRRVRIGSRYSLSNLHKDTLRGGYVYRNNQIRSNSLPPSIHRRKGFASGFLHEAHESSLNVLDHTLQNSFRLENYDHRRRSTDNLQLQKHSVKSIRKRSEGSELADHFTDNNNHYPEDDYDSGHRNGSNDGGGPHSEVDQTPDKLSGLQFPEQPNNNIDHDTVGLGLSYRAPAFIESRATWQYGAHRPEVPVAQSQLLDEDDNTTDSHTGDDGTKSGSLNEEQDEEDISEVDHLGQPADRLSLSEGQAQNYTDTDSTGHLEDSQDTDKLEETRISESVIHLDLIQDTDGESLKPQPDEQEDGNPLLHEEGNSNWESSPSEAFYDKSGEDYVAEGEEEGEKETGEETAAEGSGVVEKQRGEMNPSSEPEVEEEVISEEPEPEYPEPEAEFPEPEAEEPEPGDSNTHDEISYAEPEPNWEAAKDIWGLAWELHIYVAGVGFAVLAVYSLISILRLYKHKNLLSLAYFLSLNAIMALMGITRAVYFLVDGYNTRGTFHPVLYYFLYSVGFPCITSSFSILFMALLQTTKMQLLPPEIQRTSILIMIIVLHFMISILTDFVVGYFSNAAMLMLVCQLATVIWGLFLFGGYLYIFKKLYRNAQWRQREMTRYQLSQIKLEGVTPITKTPKLTLNIAIRVTLVTAIFGLLFAGIITYSMFGVFSIFSDTVPKAWPWWFFKFSMRIVELAMCATMSYVATQPFRYNSEISTKKWNCSSVLFYFPCRRLCLCNEHELRDDGLHWIDNQLYAHDSGLSVSGDINAFNSNPVLVEESIPITSCHHPTSKHTTGTGISDSGSTSSHRATSNTEQSQQGASRPTSLLVKENGLVRFRQEGDEDADPVVLSTEDELDLQDPEVMDNPFAAAVAQHQRNLLLEEHPQERKGRLELLLAGQGIILPDQFGESSTEPNQSKKRSFKSSLNRRRPKYNRTKSAPGGCDTPASTRSFCSSDTFLDGNASMWSFRPPSSIHLRDSIENYLDMNLDTPDIIDSPLRAPPRSRANSHRSRWRSGPFSRNSNPSSNRYFSSTSDLQSLQEYHDVLELQQQQQHLQQEAELEHHSQDSMTFSTASDMSIDGVGRSPRRLLRSNSDSLTGTSGIPRDLSFPSGYESAESDRAFGKDDWKQLFDNKRKVQNLLDDINDLCTETSD